MQVKTDHIRFFKWVFITAVMLLLLLFTIVFSLNIPIQIGQFKMNMYNGLVAAKHSAIRKNKASSSQLITTSNEDKDWYANAQKELDARTGLNNNIIESPPQVQELIAVKQNVMTASNPETSTSGKKKKYADNVSDYEVSTPVKNDVAVSTTPRTKKEKTTTSYTSNSIKENTTVNYSLNTSSNKYPRKITQAEIDEFMRQFPNRTTTIRFVCFGNPDAEMEGVKSQIMNALQQYGYKDINKNWNLMSGYIATDEVHFGGHGYLTANFYIPALQMYSR